MRSGFINSYYTTLWTGICIKGPETLFRKTYRVKLKEEPYIKVDTRELDEVPSTICLSYIHWADGLYYTKPNLF